MVTERRDASSSSHKVYNLCMCGEEWMQNHDRILRSTRKQQDQPDTRLPTYGVTWSTSRLVSSTVV